jgi:hypothetical protein
MDIAVPLVCRHAHRGRKALLLVALALSAAALLASGVQLLAGASAGRTPEAPITAPFRWDDAAPRDVG